MALVLEAIRRRPGRSAVTALGIGLSSGLVVLLLALAAGVDQSATTLAYASGVDLLATSASSGGNSTPLNATLPPIPGAHNLSVNVPKIDPNVQVASPWLLSELVFGNASLWAAANSSGGVPPGWTLTSAGSIGWIPSMNTGLEVPPILSGPGFTVPGDPHYANGSFTGTPTQQIVLDRSLATVLGVSVGDRIFASPAAPASNGSLGAWFANATPFTLVGVSGPFWLVPSALLAYTYLSELQAITGGGTPSTDYATLLLVHLYDPTNPGLDQAKIALAFPDLTVFTLSQLLSEIQHVVNVYRTFGYLIAAIGLAVATLFATTILQMSVDDRSREMALLRAVGYTRMRVGLLVVGEGLLLAAGGLAVGLGVAWLAAHLLNEFLLGLVGGLPTGFSFVSFDPTVLVLSAAIVAAVGLLASLAPAVRAMGLPVAEELRAP